MYVDMSLVSLFLCGCLLLGVLEVYGTYKCYNCKVSSRNSDNDDGSGIGAYDGYGIDNEFRRGAHDGSLSDAHVSQSGPYECATCREADDFDDEFFYDDDDQRKKKANNDNDDEEDSSSTIIAAATVGGAVFGSLVTSICFMCYLLARKENQRQSGKERQTVLSPMIKTESISLNRNTEENKNKKGNLHEEKHDKKHNLTNESHVMCNYTEERRESYDHVKAGSSFSISSDGYETVPMNNKRNLSFSISSDGYETLSMNYERSVENPEDMNLTSNCERKYENV